MSPLVKLTGNKAGLVTPMQSAAERRAKIQAHAASIGIDEAYISTLVDTFYQQIQTHPQLGPIFAEVIGENNWDPHLATMKDFWLSVALNTGRYSGQPVPKHKAIPGIKTEHFTLWLSLFEDTLRATAAGPEAVDYIMERANRIAASLKLAIFGMPGLPLPGRS